ncbi:MAG: helix-turn-helix transcriptional regulator [Candidatus Eremiobacteraeota bacterium]|nr:helix-turn-helix transcriptional regulator [Candidatus Eremiobacteraeota bacterium]
MRSTQRANLTGVPGVLQKADELYKAGEYEAILRLLRNARLDRRDERVLSAIYQARAALTLDRPKEVAPILQRASKEVNGAEETVLVRMLLGSALTRTEQREEGEAMLEDAAALAQRSAPQHVGEVGYYRALSRWSSDRVDDAEAIVEAALPHAADYARSRLLQLAGWIDTRRENYASAARKFTEALTALNESDIRDVKGRARILNALAIIAAETIDLRLGRLVRREYEASTWSNDTRIERYLVLGFLAWLSLLEGNVVRAWDERQRGLTLTVDTAHHATALVMARYVATIVGDRFSAERYLELAGALLLRGDQVDLDVDHRSALLAYAIAVPPENVETARRVLALYDRTSPRRTEMLALEGDRRLDVYAQYARGRVLVAEGNVSRGVDQLERSFDAFMQLGYRLRAALVANDLRTVTGEERYAKAGLDALRNAPKAWLRDALQRDAPADPLAQLTRAQRRVLRELCTGKKAREIAAGFDRSFNTINNHTRAIFSAFGVRSRASLVAECARLGILDDVKALR